MPEGAPCPVRICFLGKDASETVLPTVAPLTESERVRRPLVRKKEGEGNGNEPSHLHPHQACGTCPGTCHHDHHHHDRSASSWLGAGVRARSSAAQ